MATVHSYVHSKISDPLRHVQNDRFRESRRPKNVLFYPNGKPHYKPQQLRITPHKYNSFNDLLKDLTKTVKLPFGVRRVYTPTGGTEIADLDDLEDGSTYLCASFEKFKPANYGKKPVDSRPEWGPVGGRLTQNADIVYTNLGYTPSTLQNAGTRGAGFRQYYYRSDRGTKLKPLGSTSEDSLFAPPVKRTLQKGTFGVAARDKYAGSMGHLGSRAPPNDLSLTGQAKKFRIVHDTEPSKGYDFLFNERTSDNFERILQYVSETLKQNLRKFFTLKNREIKSLRELYRCSEEVLIATAKEQITEATVKAVRDAIYSYKNNPSSSSGPYKTDSGFIDDLESEYDRTPRPKPTAGRKMVSESSPQRAVIKNSSPNRKHPRRRTGAVDEVDDDSSKPSDQQLSRVYQRRKERERKEREKIMTQQNERSEEDKRRRRQQARIDNEKRRSVKRLQLDKPAKLGPFLDVDANKENNRPSQRGRSPTAEEIAAAEQMERARRRAENLGKSTTGFDSLESAAIVKHDKSTEEQKLREQAEKAEQKRRRLQEERNRHLKKEAADKEKEKDKLKMEKDLMALSEQAEKQRKIAEAKPVDHNAQFEEANFIKKKKQNGDEHRRLSFETEEKILKDAEQNEKDRARKEREKRRANAEQEKEAIDSLPLVESEKPVKMTSPVDDSAELEEALLAERKRKEEEEENRRLEALRVEEEERQKAEEERKKAEEEEKKRAEEEAKRQAEEEARQKAEEERRRAEEEARKAEEAKRLAEEEAEKARKAAALEEAARLRKAEEERQQKEAEEKAREEERKRLEQEEAERKKREAAEKERERLEAERKKREAEEEQKRKEAEAAEAEEKRKKEEAEKKAAEEAEKEKVRPKGLILPIHEEEEIERKYELKKKMGDGNFANVYQALLRQGSIPPGAPPGQKEYAVKQIDKSKVVGSRKNTTSKVQMLKNEIDIMKNCDHPNICKLYEAYETDKHVYLVMEFVKGGDLFDAISENVKFDESQSSLIIRHLAEALDYLHSRRIVHRDIKPENLLVDKDEKGRITQVKLGDFGLAMQVKEKIYSVCGTPTYVAPEILAESGYGLEVDNWATGVISYILLCGFPPFRSIERNQDELFDTIQRGEFEYLSPYWDNISEMAKDLIDRLLVVEIRKRMKSKDVLKHKFLTSHKE